jgi:hypothetical protein
MEFGLHRVLEDCACVDHALFLVPKQGDGDKEDGETNLAVVFVPGLLDLDGNVFVRLGVKEGEDRPTGEEKAGEGEGVNVGTYHSWLVYNVKIRHNREQKNRNPEFEVNFFEVKNPTIKPGSIPGFFRGLGLT